MTADFQSRLDVWLTGAQKLIDDDWAAHKFTHAMSPVLRLDVGSRFVKVTRLDRTSAGVVLHRGSVHAFIDITGGNIGGVNHQPGDVLKPASWRAPAKHARGNLFDDKGGLGWMSSYGPAYLR